MTGGRPSARTLGAVASSADVAGKRSRLLIGLVLGGFSTAVLAGALVPLALDGYATGGYAERGSATGQTAVTVTRVSQVQPTAMATKRPARGLAAPPAPRPSATATTPNVVTPGP